MIIYKKSLTRYVCVDSSASFVFPPVAIYIDSLSLAIQCPDMETGNSGKPCTHPPAKKHSELVEDSPVPPETIAS